VFDLNGESWDVILNKVMYAEAVCSGVLDSLAYVLTSCIQ
jgi:hypothetical protein